MKIAVTTIALNEEKFAKRWADSCKDADVRLVLDTGSTDNTVNILRDCGVWVYKGIIKPWRFDVARNVGLSHLPLDIDYVITLDMDEVLEPGWRQCIEQAPPASQYTYNYHWNENVSFLGDRCFKRDSFYWRYPVHEVITPVDAEMNRREHAGFTITHHSDPTKSRSSYLQLLALAVKENPHDDRLAHYYGRELYFQGYYNNARDELMRHIKMDKWPAEKAESYRYLAKMDDYPERWILHAIACAPDRREPWLDLLRYHSKRNMPVGFIIDRILQIKDRPQDYISDKWAWDDDYIKSYGNGSLHPLTLEPLTVE